ncbi:hypothetical protein HDZ31DRAFT_3449, partial [Schizophyllum fasciatum]
MYNQKARRWLRYPKLLTQAGGKCEQLMASFLNDVHDYVRAAMTREGHTLPVKQRRWSTAQNQQCPAGRNGAGYGAVLTESGSRVSWDTVLCDLQVAERTDLMPDVVRRLSGSAANVFATQGNCLYHVGLAFSGDEYSVVIHDRAGRVQSQVYNVHQAVILVRVIVALTLSVGTPAGRDPAITLSNEGPPIITLDGVAYELVERLCGSRRIRGRGTVCWRCRREGSDEDYVIKSVWFSSKEELLSGIRDAVEAHHALYLLKILHCDVSEQNVMLRQRGATERLRRGLLIDLDCATLSPGLNLRHPLATGTLPFMSSALLLQPHIPHAPVHDLESFLYVLMWICANYSGPSGMRRKDRDWRQSPMGRWCTGTPREVGHKKWLDVYAKSRDEFRAFLDDIFDPYFDDLKDCVCDLRQTILFHQTGVSHEDVLDVLALHIRSQQA